MPSSTMNPESTLARCASNFRISRVDCAARQVVRSGLESRRLTIYHFMFDSIGKRDPGLMSTT